MPVTYSNQNQKQKQNQLNQPVTNDDWNSNLSSVRQTVASGPNNLNQTGSAVGNVKNQSSQGNTAGSYASGNKVSNTAANAVGNVQTTNQTLNNMSNTMGNALPRAYYQFQQPSTNVFSTQQNQPSQTAAPTSDYSGIAQRYDDEIKLYKKQLSNLLGKYGYTADLNDIESLFSSVKRKKGDDATTKTTRPTNSIALYLWKKGDAEWKKNPVSSWSDAAVNEIYPILQNIVNAQNLMTTANTMAKYGDGSNTGSTQATTIAPLSGDDSQGDESSQGGDSSQEGNGWLFQQDPDTGAIYIDRANAETATPHYNPILGKFGSYGDEYVDEVTGEINKPSYTSDAYVGNLKGVMEENPDEINMTEPMQSSLDDMRGVAEKAVDDILGDGTKYDYKGLSQQGYSSDDLAKMGENDFNYLNKAYNTALQKAQANYNRLGLRGSGFELADEFGNQEDSITSNYLDKVRQLQNDIDVKGLEARREDEKFDIDEKLKYAQGQNDAYGTVTSVIDRYNQDLAQEQHWIQQFGEDRANKLKDYTLQTYKLAADLDNMDDAQKLAWAKENAAEAQSDYDNALKLWTTAIDVDKEYAKNNMELAKQRMNAIAAILAQNNKEIFDAFISEMKNRQTANGFDASSVWDEMFPTSF